MDDALSPRTANLEPRPAAAGAAFLNRIRSRSRDAVWLLPGTLGVLVLTAVVYLWNLTISGYANTYYAAAALAGSQDWSAWFFGSVDASNFITIDKPPLATMVLGLSVRLFGLSSASILVPQALMGVASVAILMAIVRRTFGKAASLIAGIVMALTPAAVLIFRYDNPDALLTLLLVASAYALIRALEHGGLRWVAAAGLFVGLGFETKLLQAYLVLPAFAVTWLLAAPGSIGTRLRGLIVAGVAVLIGSAWWIAALELIPASARPYVGGSTNNSALDLVFGYDGLGRIFGQGQPGGASGGLSGGIVLPDGGTGGGAGGGAGFGGEPGILRLFNIQLGDQVAWLLPMPLIGLASGLVATWRSGRSDLRRAAWVMWGLWLAVHIIVFSFMSGIIHSYYAVVMAPAIGALVGGGIVLLWAARRDHAVAGIVLGAAIAGSAAVAWMLLERTPSFLPGFGVAVLAVGLVGAVIVGIPARGMPRFIQRAALTLALAALLVGPMAYAAATMTRAHSGGDAAAGPAERQSSVLGGLPGGAIPGDGTGQGGVPGLPDNGAGQGGPGFPGGVTGPDTGSGLPGDRSGAFGRGSPGAEFDAATLAYLVAQRGEARWIVAVADANSAASVELATGLPAMAMGGFSGADAALTVEQLQNYVTSGELRFIVSGVRGPTSGATSSVSAWVQDHCTAVTIGNTTNLFDCAPGAP